MRDLIPTILALLGGGGLVGGLIALIKLRPEAGQITVVAAQGALVVQQGVLDTLNKELARVSARLEVVEAELSNAQHRIDDLELDKARLEKEARTIKSENTKLRNRVKVLEANGDANHS